MISNSVSNTVIETLKELVPPEYVHVQEPMSKHTTFRIGGCADCLVEIGSTEELRKVQHYLRQVEIPYVITGNGSNLLVGDKGYRGVVLQLGGRFAQVTADGCRITAQAGALLSRIARTALEKGLTGFEFAAGIPGTAGGAVVMNAGAYGGEMKHVVRSVTVLDQEGNELVLDHDTMEFGYRTSVLKHRPFIVTGITLELAEGDPVRIRERMEELAKQRREKQPLEYPSAGSTFKRPEGYFAGKLIMDAQLRGFQIGGARVSDKHCGFVINVGDATAADVRALMTQVQRRVAERFQVTLEPEIIMLGEF